MDENTTSSIINRLGAGSGIDMVQLARDINEARFAVRREQIESRNETLETQISSASELRAQLIALASALGDRLRSGDLSPSAELDTPAIADVSVSAGYSPKESYELEVTQLAQNQVLALGAYASAEDLVGEGTLQIRQGTVSGASFTEDTETDAIEITVAADDTLASLATKINNAGGGTITAYVANGSAGAQLVIKGASGDQNGFTVEATSTAASPSATPGDLTYLGWEPASDAGELRQSAQDAVFKLDSIEQRSESNTISDLPEGMIFELKSTNAGAPSSLTFPSNISAISDVMKDLVAALNGIAGEVASVAAPLGGELGNDPGARLLKRKLSSLASEVVMPSAGDGEPRTLADLGLSTTREGAFELDTDRLAATLANAPDAAAAMFTTGAFGVFSTIDRMVRDTTTSGNAGTLGGSVKRYEAQVERNNELLADIAEQQESALSALTRSFIAADRSVTSSQSTLSFIQQQMALFNQDS